jgi:hypothetical protein
VVWTRLGQVKIYCECGTESACPYNAGKLSSGYVTGGLLGSAQIHRVNQLSYSPSSISVTPARNQGHLAQITLLSLLRILIPSHKTVGSELDRNKHFPRLI